jgi:hypothetical protein
VRDQSGRVAVGLATLTRRALRRMALQDWLILSYHVVLVPIALLAPDGHDHGVVARGFVLLLAFVLFSMLTVRADLLERPRASGILYRMTILCSIQASYYQMGRLLPLIYPTTLDQQILDFDLWLFGFEPAVLMNVWVTPLVTEWFSFAYYGYFFFLSLFVLPMFFLTRHVRAAGEFSLGLSFIFCVGHLLYFVVPGYGPGVALPELFTAPLGNGFWTSLMNSTVREFGAHMDIFPSIHTAVPVFLCLFAYRHRRSSLYGRALLSLSRVVPGVRSLVPGLTKGWLLASFFTLNIVIATMYLRWHYLADVVAGLALGILGYVVSVRVGEREFAHRQRAGISRIWPLLAPRRARDA